MGIHTGRFHKPHRKGLQNISFNKINLEEKSPFIELIDEN